MYLSTLLLQDFRSYPQKKINFNEGINIIVGPNTAGKTNLVESIILLSSGKSVRAEKENEMIRFGQEVAWVKGLLFSGSSKTELSVMIAQGQSTGGRLGKKYLINGVSKSRTNFAGCLPVVLFRPEELEIIIDGPSKRRNFLDQILEQTDKDYRIAKTLYDKTLRQRNALLDLARDTGQRKEDQFKYWDELLIRNGSYITEKRESFLQFINSANKDIILLKVFYDKSIISADRLTQYRDAEIGAGVTLVGPQRDDFYVDITDNSGKWRNVALFGSRGQQRLVVLQLRMLNIQYIEQTLTQKPLLLLDDIFSELDGDHIEMVINKVSGQQVIMTTTHKEFINQTLLNGSTVIELEKAT